MDPVTAILVPSILGGVAIAWLIGKLHGRGPYSVTDVRLERVSTDVINMAHIRAAGLGGLGLFAMALVVAWFVPAIRLAVGASVVLGALLGAAMIVRRRRTGPLPSSGGGSGANVILAIDRPAASGNEDGDSRRRDCASHNRRAEQYDGPSCGLTLTGASTGR